MKTFAKHLRNASLSLLTAGLTASMLLTSSPLASAHNVPYAVPYVQSFKLPHDFKVTEKGADFVMLKGKLGSVMVSYTDDGVEFEKHLINSMNHVNMINRSELEKKLESLKTSGMLQNAYMMMDKNHRDHKLAMIDKDHMQDKDHMMDKNHMQDKDQMMDKAKKISSLDLVYAYATKPISDVYKNAYIKSIKVEKVHGHYLLVTQAYADRMTMYSKHTNLVTDIAFANDKKVVNFQFTCNLYNSAKCEQAAMDLMNSIKF